MDKQLLKTVVALAAALVLAACSEAPKPAAPSAKTEAEPEKKAPEPTGPIAARTAFFEMYKPARAWAADLLPLSLTSGEVAGIVNAGGKAGLWTAVFVSPSRREARTFTYAVADQGGTIHKGVSAEVAQPWTGATAKSRPFQVTGFAVNSDDAYKAALAKASAWVRAHPGRKVSMTLVNDPRFPAPAWYVLWGNRGSGYLAFVNAVTGTAMNPH